MTKQKKTRIIIAVSVLVVCIILLLLVLFRKGRTYPLSYSETSMYVPLSGGELLELTEEGAVYRYGNDGKKTMLLESSDISYIAAVYDDGTVYMVNLHEDGTLGVCEEFDFVEKEIGNLEKPVKTGLHPKGLVVMTEAGELIEGELSEGWKAFYESEEETVKLAKVEGFSEGTDLATMILRESVCFINDGQVWVKGDFVGDLYEEYTKIPTDFYAKQVWNAGNTIFAMDDKDRLYEFGIALDVNNYSIINKQFREVSSYGKPVAFHSFGESAIVLNENGNVHYFGLTVEGKACDVSWGGILPWLKNEKQVFFFGSYIYVLGEDYLYVRREVANYFKIHFNPVSFLY